MARPVPQAQYACLRCTYTERGDLSAGGTGELEIACGRGPGIDLCFQPYHDRSG
jgi:hypothetical protein